MPFCNLSLTFICPLCVAALLIALALALALLPNSLRLMMMMTRRYRLMNFKTSFTIIFLFYRIDISSEDDHTSIRSVKSAKR